MSRDGGRPVAVTVAEEAKQANGSGKIWKRYRAYVVRKGDIVGRLDFAGLPSYASLFTFSLLQISYKKLDETEVTENKLKVNVVCFFAGSQKSRLLFSPTQFAGRRGQCQAIVFNPLVFCSRASNVSRANFAPSSSKKKMVASQTPSSKASAVVGSPRGCGLLLLLV
ncbi:hypothetical protein ACH5RR_020701 [Cinchona calisaya]|uniref:Uncharacterized protein n=1 Tax=Cinchona calisaya TaxID=153742 RepID=A0ABD2ZF72_9GENT